MPALEIGLRTRMALAYHKSHNFAAVARQFGVDVSTVKRWVARWENEGDVKTKKGPGRQRALSEAAARKAHELLHSGKFDGCKQVAEELHKLGLTDWVVHPSTLSRHAKAQALADGTPIMPKRRRPVNAIKPGTIAKRLAFCKANLKRNWDNVMITDRCKFFHRYPGTRVRQVQWCWRGEQREAFKPTNPQCVNMYVGITKNGVTKAHLVTGTSKMPTPYLNQKGKDSRNITMGEYYDVLKQTLLPEGKRLLGHNGLTLWHLQQDNDPSHKRASAKALSEWHSGGRGSVQLVAGWPPSSPDLSPIENAWAYIQARVDRVGCKTFEEFKKTLAHEWDNMDKKVYKALMASLPKRMQLCVDGGGGKIRY